MMKKTEIKTERQFIDSLLKDVEFDINIRNTPFKYTVLDSTSIPPKGIGIEIAKGVRVIYVIKKEKEEIIVKRRTNKSDRVKLVAIVQQIPEKPSRIILNTKTEFIRDLIDYNKFNLGVKEKTPVKKPSKTIIESLDEIVLEWNNTLKTQLKKTYDEIDTSLLNIKINEKYLYKIAKDRLLLGTQKPNIESLLGTIRENTVIRALIKGITKEEYIRSTIKDDMSTLTLVKVREQIVEKMILKHSIVPKGKIELSSLLRKELLKGKAEAVWVQFKVEERTGEERIYIKDLLNRLVSEDYILPYDFTIPSKGASLLVYLSKNGKNRVTCNHIEAITIFDGELIYQRKEKEK
jgi:hypothetical protein